jgi:hypothetical protein
MPRRGGAVTGDVVGLAGDLAHHLCAHVLELVGQFDLLGDGDAVLGDARCAERLVENDVAALRAERHPHGVGQDVHAAEHPVACVAGKFDFFCSHDVLPLLSASRMLSGPVGSRRRFEMMKRSRAPQWRPQWPVSLR